MLDPIIDWIKSLWRGFIALFKLRLPKPEEGGPEKFRKTRTAGRVFWRGGLLIFSSCSSFGTSRSSGTCFGRAAIR
jgi:hypothetical protein